MQRRSPTESRASRPRGRERPNHRDSKISRTRSSIRALFVVAGIGLGATILYKALPHRPRGEDRSPRSAEVLPPETIRLGKVNFFLQNPDALSSGRRRELFTNMQNAFNRLKNYFGEDTMTMYEPLGFPVIVRDQESQGHAVEHGYASWEVQLKFSASGELQIEGRPTPKELVLNEISEHVIAHELVHLFLQAPGFWSQAFFEGHAYVIENLLYPESNRGDMHELMGIPEVGVLFRDGLDHNIYDQSLQGGIQNPLLNRLALVGWELDHEDFLRRHPDFLKLFYVEIARQKKRGTVSFSKDDLIAIAIHIDSDFDAFYRASSLREIGENGSHAVVQSIIIPHRKLVVVANFRTVARAISSTNMTPPFLEPVLSGEIEITFKNSKTGEVQVRTFRSPPPPHNTFAVIDFSTFAPDVQIQRITMNGTDIPFSLATR